MKHKVGDKVKVRSFESMAAEYGVTVVSTREDYNCQKVIPHGSGFIYPTMAYFCGKEVTIDEIIGTGYGLPETTYVYYISEDQDRDPDLWEDWMFEEDENEIQ